MRRPVNQADLDTLEDPIRGYDPDPEPWGRGAIALIILFAVLGVIGLVANERAAEKAEAQVTQ